KPVQDDNGKYLPNGQSAKSGLNKSWSDAAFGQFFSIFNYIAEKAGVAVIEINPAYTSQLLPYRDEFVLLIAASENIGMKLNKFLLIEIYQQLSI
ncbi:zinc ribbon domain-containing protein, partial [Crocosphaera watsonii]|uniref:zinc ribbon domain-containing protein n=1 Tax=Crocosphaera watsonii TaxID=263511 RepID=UPI000562E92B